MKKKKQIKRKQINLKQKKFCWFYCIHSETFGNATQSYIRAYSIDESIMAIEGARRSASRLLSNVDIVAECNKFLESSCEKTVVDTELGYLIRQRNDLAVKVSAIKLYNQLNKHLETKDRSLTSGVAFM